MTQATEHKEIINELKAIREDLEFIKERIFLSREEEEDLRLAEKEYEEGKTISLDELEKTG